MSEARRHTNGPWRSYMVRNESGIEVGTESANPIATVHMSDRDSLTACANARLIAAAPELLEALQELVAGNLGQPRGVTVPALDAARAAITKAIGNPV